MGVLATGAARDGDAAGQRWAAPAWRGAGLQELHAGGRVHDAARDPDYGSAAHPPRSRRPIEYARVGAGGARGRPTEADYRRGDCRLRRAPPRRRGSRRLLAVLGRYSGLPIERARSGAEVRALEVLRAAGYALPRLNARVAGEEADLSWAAVRVLIEVDGGPFHLDVRRRRTQADPLGGCGLDGRAHQLRRRL